MSSPTPNPVVPSILIPGSPILLVGEAPGETESLLGEPFIDLAGQELKRMLAEAGIDYNSCSVTNVFPIRPPDNKIENFCGPKSSVSKSYLFPPLRQGLYIREDLLPYLERLAGFITAAGPKIIIALGATACWALLRDSRITALRGATCLGPLAPGIKILPTYHPAYILRSWPDRIVAVADLGKAKVESATSALCRQSRRIRIPESILELCGAFEEFTRRQGTLSFDIETSPGMIKCISLADSPTEATLIPFLDTRKPGGHYWTCSDEAIVWTKLKRLLESPIPKLAQNGLYDIQYLNRMGIYPKNYTHDTMILHHSLFPELEKGLGFLGSIYTQEASWKLMRSRGEDEAKRDE